MQKIKHLIGQEQTYPVLFSHFVEHVECNPGDVGARAPLLPNESWRLTFVDLRLLHGRKAIWNGKPVVTSSSVPTEPDGIIRISASMDGVRGSPTCRGDISTTFSGLQDEAKKGTPMDEAECVFIAAVGDGLEDITTVDRTGGEDEEKGCRTATDRE